MDTNNNNVLQDKMLDATFDGVEVECSAEEAELMGAFAEDALSLEDAQDAMYSGDQNS